jgi:TM2 domain-containing membrane protein YozV
MSTELHRRRVAVALAWLGAFTPGPIPLSGLHKFYLRQPMWGAVYLLLGWTQVPRIACAVEGVWLMTRPLESFAMDETNQPLSQPPTIDVAQVNALSVALRELDALRQDGLISELEFEQKRRQLLDQVG